jgi:hypothetical protein
VARLKQCEGESDEAFATRLEERKTRLRKTDSEYHRRRYKEDPEFRARKIATASEYNANPENRQTRLSTHKNSRARVRQAEIDSCGNPDRCQCCDEPFVPNRKSPDGRYVDHDHESGAVREILCNRCNAERGQVEAAIRAGRLNRHLVAIQRHAAPVEPEIRAGKHRRIRPPSHGLFDPPPTDDQSKNDPRPGV